MQTQPTNSTQELQPRNKSCRNLNYPTASMNQQVNNDPLSDVPLDDEPDQNNASQNDKELQPRKTISWKKSCNSSLNENNMQSSALLHRLFLNDDDHKNSTNRQQVNNDPGLPLHDDEDESNGSQNDQLEIVQPNIQQRVLEAFHGEQQHENDNLRNQDVPIGENGQHK